MSALWRILVVEDDGAIRDAVAEVLASEGYAVGAARHGAEALEWVRREGRPDLFVLDLVMPVMSGPELLERLRADPVLRRVPVVLMTAAIPSEESPIPAVDAVLRKPFDLEELLSAVARLRARAP